MGLDSQLFFLTTPAHLVKILLGVDFNPPATPRSEMLTNAVKLGLIIPALYTFVKNFRLVSLAILCNPRGNMLGQSIFDCILSCRFNIFLPIKVTPFRKQFWNFKWIIAHLWASAFSTNFRGEIPGPPLMECMGMRKLFALELCARQNSSPYSFYHTSRYRKTTGMRGPLVL